MNYKQFTIHKYKAVEKAVISLNNNLIPIIGINESGKTSILQGIVAFDRNCDTLLHGEHLKAKNRYNPSAKDLSVSAEINIDEEDKKKLLNHLKSIGGFSRTKIFKEVEDFLKSKDILCISRNLHTNEYKIEGLSLEHKIMTALINYILSETPFLIYYDDFTDRVPPKIEFPLDYFNNEEMSKQDQVEEESGEEEPEEYKTDEWHEIIKEIFYRAKDDESAIDEFVKMEDDQDQAGILSDVSDKLNEDIIKNWDRLKVLNSELKKEMPDLTLKLEYEKFEKKHIFSFIVTDKKHEEKDRFFTVNERSKGFQWFFNFALKLKYNTKYVDTIENAIYILDEPGSYLHSSAQIELLKSLKSISETNKVIFCTHSHYLLDPDIINVSSIKIALRKKSAILLQNFNEYKESSKTQGALDPLFHSLQLNIGSSLRIKENNIIITEGIIDYYFFKMVREFTNYFKRLKFEIIPGAGAHNLKDLISYSIAWSNKYTVLLDSNSAGNKAFKSYKDYFEDEEADKWIQYTLPSKTSGVKLEHFLDDIDKNSLKTITSKDDIKKTIILLYFKPTQEKKRFFKSLHSETETNIKHIVNIIISKF